MNYLYSGGSRWRGLPIVGVHLINLGQLHSERLIFCTGHLLVRLLGILLLLCLEPPKSGVTYLDGPISPHL
jgi:hypothetical protein